MRYKATISLEHDLLERIDCAARARGLNRSGFVRNAVIEFLAEPISRRSFQRVATVSEFNQLVLDVVLDENAPERREGIIRLVAERMEQFHAAR